MDYSETTHLIIVCCHAIYNPVPTSTSSPAMPGPVPVPSSDSSWLLAPFQANEPPTFIAHAQAGLKLLALSPETSLLVFSGSKTRAEVDRSEARSYLDLCEEQGYWRLFNLDESLDKGANENVVKSRDAERTMREDVRRTERPIRREKLTNRILLEEQALDSFSNIIFSLLLFWKTTKTWPKKISIISHEFKRPRFLSLHITSLYYPLSLVDFVGIDPEYMVPGSSSFDAEKADEVRIGESERGYAAWEADLYGRGDLLRGKRKSRNFWGTSQMWFDTEEERKASAVSSVVLEWLDTNDEVVREEILGRGRQPWQI